MGIQKIFFAAILFFLLPRVVFAQTTEVGLNLGASGYMGDLNPNKPLDFSGLAFGAYVKKNLDPYWGIGLYYEHGTIKANDATSSDASFRSRNLNFSSPINELSLQIDFNFLDYFAGGGTRNFTPYIFTGIGGVLFNPKATYQNQEYELRYYDTEGKNYRNYAMSIPYGVGMKCRISDHLGLFTQIGYRTAFTDYLDDVGDKYPLVSVYGKVDAAHPLEINLSDPSQLLHTHNPGGQRGDYSPHDTYFFLHVGISYTFLSDKCYAF